MGTELRRLLATVLLSVLISILTPAAASAAPVFTDGFESGNFSAWTAANGPITVQTGVKFAGTHAVRATMSGTTANVYKTLASTYTDLYFDTRFNVLSSSTTTTILRFRQGGGTAIASVHVNSSGFLVRKNHIDATQDMTSGTAASKDAWHELQMHATINGASSLFEVWLDGSLVGDISGTVNLGSNPISRVQLGGSTSTSDTVWDEVIVDTSFIGSGPPADPPPTPGNLHTTDVTSTTVDLAWDSSPGATTYNIRRNGSVVGPSLTTTSFHDTGLTPSTQYSYTVDACITQCSAQSSQLLVTTDPTGGGGGMVIMAAGDIACDPADAGFNSGNGTATRCRQKFTAQLITAANPGAVLALGDTQYDCGGASAYTQSYDPTWGAFKNKTYPIVADEEYDTVGTGCGAAGADGYFNYFANAPQDAPGAPNGYYSFDLLGWHFIGLNSQCGKIPGGCAEGGAQNNFLENDLNSNTETCTLAMLHNPRFASNKSFSQINANMKPFWDDLVAEKADIILAGNSHFYERFEPQNANGVPDPNGMVEFIVGTGGKSHGGLADPANRLRTSEAGTSDTFGVLKLTLHPTSYDWEFVVEGSSGFTDSGTASCVA
jgi:hypothetical protein